MEFLSDWAKNIVYYILLVKLISQLLPNGNMSKYIKLFTGVLLIVVVMEPILSLRNLDQKVLSNIMNMENMLAHKDYNSQSKTYNQINDQLAINLYKKQVEEHIRKLVHDEGVEVSRIEIEVNEDEGDHFGEIVAMNLNVRKETANKGVTIDKIEIGNHHTAHDVTAEDIIIEKNIKIALRGFYNIAPDNMNISISQ
ncbi:MAG: stage III sporulation protein AF [Firmicutes bacterium HGW-Firmicutes-1]|jgi:stage III sporulation protein AF|nr:MAG: stage III sporulation protein AF [Firmicutes bacterium HGW-Firmicutes-1]